jgi:hypothetical protein
MRTKLAVAVTMSLAGTALAKDTGVWKFTTPATDGSKNTGVMRLGRHGDVVCGTFLFDGDTHKLPGWISLAIKDKDLAGTWQWTQETGTMKLVADGSTLKGSWEYDADTSKTKDKAEFVATYGSAIPGSVTASGTYRVDFGSWTGIVTFAQKGSALTGTCKMPSSDEDCGHWNGTLSGDLAVGAYDYIDGGEKQAENFQIAFKATIAGMTFDGSWGKTENKAPSCHNIDHMRGGPDK